MPAFTYTGTEPRYYPSLSLAVQPGDSVTLDSDPGDGRWTAGTKAAPTKAPEPAPVAPTDTPEVGN
jgi:hypothetical protein